MADRFPECVFSVAGDGRVVPTSSQALRAHHQTWAWERRRQLWRFDVFREPHDGDTWICRRDERIRRSCAEVIQDSCDGLPYLSAEIVLLFKAKAMLDKDQADFQAAAPVLSIEQRRWLRDALRLVHPDHPLATLAGIVRGQVSLATASAERPREVTIATDATDEHRRAPTG